MGDGAPFVHARARGGAHVQRGGVSAGARLAVQAARRWHSLLHRCQTMQPISPRGTDLHAIFSRSVHIAYIDAMHARRGAGDCEARRSHLLNFVRADQTRRRTWLQRVRGQTRPAFIRTKADTGPEGGIPQIAPRNTPSSQRIDRALFAQRNRRGHTR